MMEIDDNMPSLNFSVVPQEESIIKVIGVGGGGSNAVNHMFAQGICGVEFVVCNTDIQALRHSRVRNRIQLGKRLTEGRGAGSLREQGKLAALESIEYIDDILKHNTKMIFITAGMGGGTGTGAAPVIASRARELGILTIGIVTVPFTFEGKRKVDQAMAGIDELESQVDALLIIINDRLLDMYGNLPLSEAFAKADNILTIAAKSIAEIITIRGHVNVDFADVKSVMKDSGVALMGAGEAEGENRALEALEEALVSPLLNNNEIRGASNILLNMLYENKEILGRERKLITDTLRQKIGQNVDLIWGVGKVDGLGDKLRVSVIATGFNRKTRVLGEDMSGEGEGKTKFKVESMADDLQLEMLDAEALENEARIRRQKQKEEPVRKMKKANKMQGGDSEGTLGVNEMPNMNTWLGRKIGKTIGKMDSIFDE